MALNVKRDDWHHIFFNDYVPCSQCHLYSASNCSKEHVSKPCKYDSDVDDERDYDILNQNQENALMFCDEHQGFYFFKVRVIDPTLSYCELSTEFAIEILGPTYAEVEPIPYIIVVLCAILIVALIVGLSYLRFTGIFKKHMAIHYKRQDAALEEMQRLRNESRSSQSLLSKSMVMDQLPVNNKRFSHHSHQT